jgi:alpha-tubulin suppressor-like RCC1 family protein
VGLAWGLGNEYGQLGDGNLTPSLSPPVETLYPSPVSAVAATVDHSMGLLSNGVVVAWGLNEHGTLGNGSETQAYSDVPVSVCAPNETARPCNNHLTNVSAIATGGEHDLALLNSGEVVAWGDNAWGQLGNGTEGNGAQTANSPVPVHVCAIAVTAEECIKEHKFLKGVTAIAAGDEHSLALLGNGTVVTWGWDNYGQLGNGKIGEQESSEVPIVVEGLGGKAKAIGAGYFHSLAVLRNGTVKDWGYGETGELGNGGELDSAVPVSVSNLSGVTAVTGDYATSFALLSNGKVMSWGSNWPLGELGHGSFAGPELCGPVYCSKVPVSVSGLSEATAIAADEGHSAIALRRNGAIVEWGGNAAGNHECFEEAPCYTSAVEYKDVHGATAIAAGNGFRLAKGEP